MKGLGYTYVYAYEGYDQAARVLDLASATDDDDYCCCPYYY